MPGPKRGTPDFLLLILTFGLIGFGVVMVFSASYNTSLHDFGDPLYFTKRQILWTALGSAALFVLMNLSFRFVKRLSVPFFMLIVSLLVLVLLFGQVRNGARSWFAIGSFGGQPTEFAKLGLIMYLSYVISNRGEKIKEFKKGLLPLLIITGVVAGLIMLQPDFGSCVVLVAIAAIVIIAGGARMLHIGLLGAASAGLAVIYVMIQLAQGDLGYRMKRLTSYMNPWQDSLGSGYQLIQSWFALGHGGLTGAGFGQSIQKLSYLPEAHNDFIFSIIGEELGFVGACAFILIYLALIWRGIVIAVRCKEIYGTLTGIGIVSMFALQAMINIGGVTGAIPITGITIPLISFGGSSLFASMMALGILLNISRENNRVEKEKHGESATRSMQHPS